MKKEEIIVIEFCVRANISVQMGGIGSAILTKTEKKKMFIAGVWIRMTQCQKARSENLH